MSAVELSSVWFGSINWIACQRQCHILMPSYQIDEITYGKYNSSDLASSCYLREKKQSMHLKWKWFFLERENGIEISCTSKWEGWILNRFFTFFLGKHRSRVCSFHFIFSSNWHSMHLIFSPTNGNREKLSSYFHGSHGFYLSYFPNEV